MMIIDAITTRPSNRLPLWTPTPENYKSGGCSTPRKRKSSTAISRHKE